MQRGSVSSVVRSMCLSVCLSVWFEEELDVKDNVDHRVEKTVHEDREHQRSSWHCRGLRTSSGGLCVAWLGLTACVCLCLGR